ncbi:sensor histidine kinase [Chitinophaga ginsengisegetis]|uniref:sensor histidine kinase n=1 Tax=Chitinophaga ginsengisegetis TaxID=393003 RepID=UPI000DB9DE99|nr:HAMP domain-containing sensor histidine kinase [Chitinophaga ginsengisegetis]MDR6565469.1 signal transduction histidine kinase [Chitinophaga ginsengisegetis]MDR6645197.1 signal transduction histidine kinase [Chitinophaga ginsengisegetis]MDR6652211.1 signal transduction histidine kinase [Chitinophaga ginsengisegetis]
MFRLLNLVFTTKASLLRQLKEKEKLIRFNTRFIRSWAHDQGTAINAINAAVHFMEDRGTVTQSDLDLLNTGIQLLKDGSSNLIDLLKDKPTIKNQFVDLVEILENVIRLYTGLARFNHVIIVLQLEGSAPVNIYSDGLIIQRILGNLLSNAIKFSPPGEKIIVRVYGEHKYLFFQVEDKGPGIPPARHREIFRPYVKLDENKLGTGLGLSICRQFSQLLGGDIAVQSTDKGSIFSFKIKAVNV